MCWQPLGTSSCISQPAAAALDSATITEGDLRQALRRARSGTSPGCDGLPSEVFTRHADVFYPLLARLFSMMLARGDMPAGFHDGTLVVLHKTGDRASPANYRPITLLNTDYPAFMRVMAGCLGAALGGAIDPQQSAFLPGRRIGDSIITLQLLPRLLRHERRPALAVLCDFRKAYNIVDRGFLLQALTLALRRRARLELRPMAPSQQAVSNLGW